MSQNKDKTILLRYDLHGVALPRVIYYKNVDWNVKIVIYHPIDISTKHGILRWFGHLSPTEPKLKLLHGSTVNIPMRRILIREEIQIFQTKLIIANFINIESDYDVTNKSCLVRVITPTEL